MLLQLGFCPKKKIASPDFWNPTFAAQRTALPSVKNNVITNDFKISSMELYLPLQYDGYV